MQQEGALAQKLVDDAKVALAQARESQFDTAQRHLETLNQVSQREAIRGVEAQMNAAKAHYDNTAVQLFTRGSSVPSRGWCRTVRCDTRARSRPAELALILSIVDISASRGALPMSR